MATRELYRPGGIAQLVEHMLCKHGVAGSNPTTSTKKGFDEDVGAFFRGGGWLRQPLCPVRGSAP